MWEDENTGPLWLCLCEGQCVGDATYNKQASFRKKHLLVAMNSRVCVGRDVLCAAVKTTWMRKVLIK